MPPALEFTLAVDAIKLVPITEPGPYVLQWYFSDEHQGRTEAVAPHADEVEFGLKAKFVVEASKSPIARLLQLTVMEVKGDVEQQQQLHELVGVLTIDLNAHVPRSPARTSRQRATLALSRCPFPQPLMVRLTIESGPALPVVRREPSSVSTASATAMKELSVPQTGTRSNNNGSTDRARSVTGGPDAPVRPMQEQAASARTPLTATPLQRSHSTTEATGSKGSAGRGVATVLGAEADHGAEIARLKATLTAMQSNMEHLRDENVLLRKTAADARKEIGYTYAAERKGTTTDAAQQVRTTVMPEAAAAMRLESENLALKAEIAVLQKGLQSAREQIRATTEREEEQRREVANLTRSNAFHLDEAERLEAELQSLREKYATSLGILGDDESEVDTMRSFVSATKQSAKELQAMLRQSEDKTKELEATVAGLQQRVTDETRRRKAAEGVHGAQAREALTRAENAEQAVRAGQIELNRLHKYSCEMNDKCRQLGDAWAKERTIAEKRKARIRDLESLLAAQSVVQTHINHGMFFPVAQNTAVDL